MNLKNKLIVMVLIAGSFAIGFCLNNFLNKHIEPTKRIITQNDALIRYSEREGTKLPGKGLVSNESLAVELAKDYFEAVYGAESQKEFHHNFKVKLINDIWIIEGDRKFAPNEKGGVPHIEIRKRDGAVLYLIHGK